MFTKKISEIVSLIRSGKLTASELCEECLGRAAKSRSLNLFITETPSISRAAAFNIDQRIDKREINSNSQQHNLLGIPVAIKDNFSTRGIKTTCASAMLKNYTPPYNATVVQKLLNHGSLLVGKTNMDEFAMGSCSIDSAFGPVKNPWKLLDKMIANKKNHENNKNELNNINNNNIKNKTNIGNRKNMNNNVTYKNDNKNNLSLQDGDFCVSGGSSGGSAVAVAIGAAFVGIGSDTGGSVRNPASHCGVVGLKPSYGRCSRHGLIPLVNSLDTPGIITRTVDDAATVLNCLSGHDPKDSTSVREDLKTISLPHTTPLQGLTIAIPKEYHPPGLQKDVLNAWMHIADILERGGAKVIDVSMPHTQLSIKCYRVIGSTEVASNMARYDGLRFGERGLDESSTEAMYAHTRKQHLGHVVRSRILAGNYFLLKKNYQKYYMRALKIRRLISNDFRKLFQSGTNLILTPTVPTTAPSYNSFFQSDNVDPSLSEDFCTQAVNLAGVPAISLPVSLSEGGLPIGMQLIGQYLREDQVLTAAKFIEQKSNFPFIVNHEFFDE